MAFTTSFPLLREELSIRWNTPKGHVSFWVYLFVAILGAGAVGIWVEIIKASLSEKHNTESILTAIYTYFPAIAAGAALQLLMDAKKENQQFLRSFCVLCIFIVGLLTVPYSTGLVKSYWAYFWGILGMFASTWLWWIANGCTTTFLDLEATATMGGDPRTEPAGNTDGYDLGKPK